MLRRTAVLLMAVLTGLLVATGCTGADTHTPSAAATPSAGGDTGPQPAAGTSSSAGSPPSAAPLQQRYNHVVATVRPSIVEIRAGRGLGSGVIYDKQGHIVTNAHVVGDRTHFKVLLAHRAQPVPATLVASYPPNDLAVIKIEPTKNLNPATFGDSSTLDVGDIVLAMGNPLGLSGTVTQGIVSALGRTVSEPAGSHSPGATLPSVIQTSAAINPGNSGGALVNLDGKVVGINTLAAVLPKMGSTAPGIGFAIPSSTVVNVADQLIKYGEVRHSNRAALGIRARTVLDERGRPTGVGIVSVEQGGGADRAGLESGQVIVELNGHRVRSTSALSQRLAQFEPGQDVKVTVVTTAGGRETYRVTLGELESAQTPAGG